VTGCWRRRCRRGMVASRPVHVRRARGSDRRSARCAACVRRNVEGDTRAAKNEAHRGADA
jgi:hypothetical protein